MAVPFQQYIEKLGLHVNDLKAAKNIYKVIPQNMELSSDNQHE